MYAFPQSSVLIGTEVVGDFVKVEGPDAPQCVGTKLLKSEARSTVAKAKGHECCICLESAKLRPGQHLITCGTCKKAMHLECAMKLQDTSCPNCRAKLFDRPPAGHYHYTVESDSDYELPHNHAWDYSGSSSGSEADTLILAEVDHSEMLRLGIGVVQYECRQSFIWEHLKGLYELESYPRSSEGEALLRAVSNLYDTMGQPWLSDRHEHRRAVLQNVREYNARHGNIPLSSLVLVDDSYLRTNTLVTAHSRLDNEHARLEFRELQRANTLQAQARALRGLEFGK